MSRSPSPIKRLLAALALLALALIGCRSSTFSNPPSWVKANVLSAKEDHPSKIVSDNDAVYYVTGGTVASQHEGTNNIKRISLKDGATSIIVKGGDLIPESSLAIDDKFLYWSDGGNLYRVPKHGGTSEKIIPGAPQPDEMIMDEENFYWLIWTGEGSPPQPIMYAPKKGGDAKPLTPPLPPTTAICLDGDTVFFMTGDGLKKIPKAGGAIVDVYRNRLKTPTLGLLQDKDNFYFMQMNSRGHSSLMKLSKGGGEPTQLTPSINHTMDFVLAGGYIYYFDEVPGMGSFGPVALRRVSTSGGDSVALDQGEGGWIKYLDVDAKQVYFTDISKVYSLPK